MNTTTTSLQEAYETARAENPKMRIRDIARHLNTSEAQLVAIKEGNIFLNNQFSNLLEEVHTLGYVMALTRNDHAVHERKGVYNNMSFEGMMGLAVNEDIDLRLFMMNWKYGFAVTEGERKSLQFFDKIGEAVHKIYLTEKSDEAAYTALVEKFAAPEALPELLPTEAAAPVPAELPDSEIDVTAFQQEWLALEDTHHFFGLLRKYKLSRTQALRLAPEGMAKAINVDTSRKMLQAAAEQQLPVMVFVGSKGCIQIHTGTVSNLMETGPWYNVLDPEFNLHLREDAIASTYIVKKPSVDGIVTSIEVFDAAGEMIVQFFGKRKPGNPELEGWRTIVAGL